MKRRILILLAFLPLFVGAQTYSIRKGGDIVAFQSSLTVKPPYDYNDYADSVFARMALPPDDNRKLLISNTIDMFEAANLWDKVDVRYFLNAHDVQASTVDWKSDSLKIIPQNEVTFIIDTGWYSNLYGAYLNTSYNTALSSSNYTNTNSSFNVGTASAGTVNQVVFGALDGSIRNQLNTTQETGGHVYYQNGVFNVPNSSQVYDTIGLYTSTINTDVYSVYQNGVLQVSKTSVTPLGLANLDNYLLCYNNAGVPTSTTTSIVNYFDAGAALTATEVSNLSSIIDYYNDNMQPSVTRYVDLITIDGQSNANGMQAIGDSLQRLMFGSEMWDSTTSELTWIDGSTGIMGQPVNTNRVNPVYTTALKYDSAVSKVFLVNFAVGGAGLYERVDYIDWNANSVDEYLDRYLNYIDSAIKYMGERNIEVRTLYRVKFQGESDADHLDPAEAFEVNETALINKYNARFPTQTKRHILIEITDNRAYSGIVNTALNNIARDRSDTQIINNDSFNYYDGTHLDISSHLWLGNKIFELTYTELE